MPQDWLVNPPALRKRRTSLQGVDVLPVEQNGADQLHAVKSVGGDGPPVFLLLADDAAVVHELPEPPVPRRDLAGARSSRQREAVVPPRYCAGDFCRFAPGDACELDFDAKVIGKQMACPPSFLCVFLEGVHGCASK